MIDPYDVVPYYVITEALRDVNEIRKQHECAPLQKMPEGEVGNPRACPLFRALSDIPDVEGVTHMYIAWKHKNRVTPAPSSFEPFIGWFDANEE